MSLTADSTGTKWQRMVRELQAAGFTYDSIAIQCQLRGVHYTPDSVKNLALGRRQQPLYDPGTVIVDMHTRFCRTTFPSE